MTQAQIQKTLYANGLKSPSLRGYWIEVFSVAWETALSETREEYSQAQLLDQWLFINEIDAFLIEKFWNRDE